VGGGIPATSAWAQVITEAFPEHAILGEEGGVSGDTASEYLWCARLGRWAPHSACRSMLSLCSPGPRAPVLASPWPRVLALGHAADASTHACCALRTSVAGLAQARQPPKPRRESRLGAGGAGWWA